ncbi:phospholipase D-like domain-containing protein [Dictyobacter aurantiacus]|uniref:phospholipase D n=1 Tax=Dictyobacter aurantiacus TaxID=1936993 RepID=A0A401ZA63_9CHLR|nr:phospholipase D-like domain-containing protein [Dictyobacter aurantiacus]GCE03696.1 cardiolipin synthase [Dictyobacter aurantiacus]
MMEHSSSHLKTYVWGWLYMCLLLCLTLAGCSTTSKSITISLGSTATQPPAAADTNTSTTGAQGVKLYIEPDAGEKVITNEINGAQKSVWLEIYLLTDKKVITALEDAAHRRVDVRVMLEVHPYGSGSVSPQQTMEKLRAAGIKTQATSPDFALTHEKGMIIDGQTAYIMTSNFTNTALGNSKYTLNREYGIIDNNAQDVKSVRDIFNADWNRQPFKLNNPHLVVSPLNAHSTFLSLIGSAQKSVSIEAEEMQDSRVEQALTTAARRGVKIQIVLPDSSSDSNREGISTIKKGGIQVKLDKRLYMHAKIIIVDQRKAFVGSENISTASLDKNRELGIIVSDAPVINALNQTFQADWQVSDKA